MNEPPDVTGFGAIDLGDTVGLQLNGAGRLSVGGILTRAVAAKLGRTLLDMTGNAAGQAEADRLREKNRRLAAEIDHMRLVLERKNRELDALHYVWCDGGCQRGVHRWISTPVTREIVEHAERQARRLRRWYRIVELRAKLPGGDLWQRKHWGKALAKTDIERPEALSSPQDSR